MFDKWISDVVLTVLRWFVDVEWERLRLTWWSGVQLVLQHHGLKAACL